MTPSQIDQAAALLADARRAQNRVDLLPVACRPATPEDAHAIQDAVTTALGKPVGAFKSGPTTRGVIYADSIYQSPAAVPVAEVPQCGVEGEVAFIFRHDLPPRATPYSPAEVAAAVDACVTIEPVTSRYANPDAASPLEKLADCSSNGGLVVGSRRSEWRHLDFATIPVTLTVNGNSVLNQNGGLPSGDPLANVVALVAMMGSVRAGQVVTCGSYTGLRYLKPGDTCTAHFDGLGEAELTFTP